MKPPSRSSHKEEPMNRFRCFLMCIVISCILSGCNIVGMSSAVSQQTSGDEGRVIDQTTPEEETLAYGLRQVGESMGRPDLPEQGVDATPFAEERFVYRPTRAGGMSTIQNPKGVPYSEHTPLMARE